ncbi:MAG: hypothetical protein ACYCSI_14385 [Solirubrobacteraceae bacterium]
MVGAVFAIVIVAVFLIAVAIGLAWFVAVPIAVFLLLFPIAYLVALFTKPKGARGGTPRAPSTADASYQPVSDPKHPGTMPR